MIIIEVLGIGFPNKGAELMLVAIKEWAEGLNKNVRIVVRWDCPYDYRAAYGLWTRVWHRNGSRFPVGNFIKFIPKGFRDRLGIVLEEEIDLFLDASGYAYGDPWGAQKANDRLGSRIAVWRKLGKPVILLPQAFGPFENSNMKSEMAAIIQQASLVYPRDAISLQAVQKLAPNLDNVRRGQDFTGLVSGKPFEGMENLQGAIGIIPNHKLFEMGRSTGKDAYLGYLTAVAAGMKQAGYKVVLILHEGERDRKLCEQINDASENSYPILAPQDPKEIKMAIGCCAAVLTSRFHGFASALFQGIPAIATSWSHKYEELALEFCVPDSVLRVLDASSTVESLKTMGDPIASAELRNRISMQSKRIKEDIRSMWVEIEKLAGIK
jgi:polysaccharide pyruvyl transferase WcaK-like protein